MSVGIYKWLSPVWFYPLELSIISTIIILSLQHQAQLLHCFFTSQALPREPPLPQHIYKQNPT